MASAAACRSNASNSTTPGWLRTQSSKPPNALSIASNVPAPRIYCAAREYLPTLRTAFYQQACPEREVPANGALSSVPGDAYCVLDIRAMVCCRGFPGDALCIAKIGAMGCRFWFPGNEFPVLMAFGRSSSGRGVVALRAFFVSVP